VCLCVASCTCTRARCVCGVWCEGGLCVWPCPLTWSRGGTQMPRGLGGCFWIGMLLQHRFGVRTAACLLLQKAGESVSTRAPPTTERSRSIWILHHVADGIRHAHPSIHHKCKSCKSNRSIRNKQTNKQTTTSKNKKTTASSTALSLAPPSLFLCRCLANFSLYSHCSS
jgi:hypothetical protein